jgi:hypothetical protein
MVSKNSEKMSFHVIVKTRNFPNSSCEKWRRGYLLVLEYTRRIDLLNRNTESLSFYYYKLRSYPACCVLLLYFFMSVHVF